MEVALARRFELEHAARAALDASARAWFVITALGQWVFAFYIAALFGPLLARHGLEGLKQSHLFNGFIPGDTTGNAALAAHVVLAFIIMAGGLAAITILTGIGVFLVATQSWLARL